MLLRSLNRYFSTSNIYMTRVTQPIDYENFFFQFSRQAKWNPSFSDRELYFHPNSISHFYMGYVNYTPAFSVGFTIFEKPKIMFAGMYYCLPEFRHVGNCFIYATTKFNELKKNCDILAMSGTPLMGRKYQNKMGVKIRGKIFRRRLFLEPEKLCKKSYDTEVIKDVRVIDMDKLLKYDLEVCGYDRSEIIKKLPVIDPFNVNCLVYESNGLIQGYGVLRRCVEGYRVGPLLAENPKIASEILNALKTKVFGSGDVLVTVDVGEEQEQWSQREFWDRSGFDFNDEKFFYLQCTEKFPCDWKRTFGIFSIEIGI